MGKRTRRSAHYAINPLSVRKWWAATVPPRVLRFKRPLHHFNGCSPGREGEAEFWSDGVLEWWKAALL